MSDHGRFIWYELMTPDTAGAKAFYPALLPWDLDETTGAAMNYTMAGPGAAIAGIMETPAEAKAMGVPPNWSAYVHVDDVDAAVGKAQQLGGSVFVPPTDIPDIGRFAVLADPTGAAIAVMTPAPMDAPPASAEPGSPGTVGWRELYAGDLEPAFAFYTELFGWKKDSDMDMGEMGPYRLFSNQDGPMGGMMTRPATMPVAAWLYYFNVADIDAAAALVTAAGGKVLLRPMVVPDGSWIVQALDPQGAMFALVGKRAA
jgi:predicted enzyme related to lactoylglutathione lyase